MKDKIWKVHQSHMAPNTDDGDDTWRIKVHLGAAHVNSGYAFILIPILYYEVRQLLHWLWLIEGSIGQSYMTRFGLEDSSFLL